MSHNLDNFVFREMFVLSVRSVEMGGMGGGGIISQLVKGFRAI